MEVMEVTERMTIFECSLCLLRLPDILFIKNNNIPCNAKNVKQKTQLRVISAIFVDLAIIVTSQT